MRAVARFADGLTLAFCAVSEWGWVNALAGDGRCPSGIGVSVGHVWFLSFGCS